MSTILHDSASRDARTAWLWNRDMWTSLAITAMWVAVALTAIFGSDIRSIDAAGQGSVVPSAVVVALFAAIASWAVARFGFRRES